MSKDKTLAALKTAVARPVREPSGFDPRKPRLRSVRKEVRR